MFTVPITKIEYLILKDSFFGHESLLIPFDCIHLIGLPFLAACLLSLSSCPDLWRRLMTVWRIGRAQTSRHAPAVPLGQRRDYYLTSAVLERGGCVNIGYGGESGKFVCLPDVISSHSALVEWENLVHGDKFSPWKGLCGHTSYIANSSVLRALRRKKDFLHF